VVAARAVQLAQASLERAKPMMALDATSRGSDTVSDEPVLPGIVGNSRPLGSGLLIDNLQAQG
jgi:hypothetical protein